MKRIHVLALVLALFGPVAAAEPSPPFQILTGEERQFWIQQDEQLTIWCQWDEALERIVSYRLNVIGGKDPTVLPTPITTPTPTNMVTSVVVNGVDPTWATAVVRGAGRPANVAYQIHILAETVSGNLVACDVRCDRWDVLYKPR